MSSSSSRKRSHSIESDPAVLKRRVIADENGAPHVGINGDVSTQEVEPSADDKLELFRKEAIYRRMKHYSRENERSQSRIAELEERKMTCEAGLAAMSACWQQLVDTLRSLVGPDESTPTSDEIRDLYHLSTFVSEDSMPELKSSLTKTQDATTEVVSKLLSKPTVASGEHRDTEHQKAQAECAALRSQLDVLQIRLQDSEDRNERYREMLAASENRFERLKSKTVQEIQPKAKTGHTLEDQEGVTETEQKKPSSPAPNGEVVVSRQDDWQDIADHREKKIQELEELVTQMTQEVQVPSTSQVLQSTQYKSLMAKCSQMTVTLGERELEISKLREELNTSTEAHSKSEDALKDIAQQEINELKASLTQRDKDLARLRESRDQQTAELHERKTKDSLKLGSYEEYKSLAASQSERIDVLTSQLKRCKAQLAAQANREDIIKFLLEGEDMNHTEYLRKQLAIAEGRIEALDEAIAKLHPEHLDIARHVQGEADARQELFIARKELEKYRKVYGDLPSASADLQQLATQLQQKEEELQNLRLLESQREQNEATLYTEIDKLSSAWEMLDQQIKSKVFDLTSMEEKLAKALQEKAKADNKYYSIMRDKDATEMERKALARNLEKHAKAVDALKEQETALTQQLTLARNLMKVREQSNESQNKLIKTLELKNAEFQASLDEMRRRLNVAQTVLDNNTKWIQLERGKLSKATEETIRAQKDLERQKLKLKSKERLVSRPLNTDKTDSSEAHSLPSAKAVLTQELLQDNGNAPPAVCISY
ncbi:e3 ubiquitin-protein ligase bre1 [Moniliophthora roreri]|nr:e3 ubiquitin-protein ligase bre1 [Moniliophthora roreri]